MGQRTCGGNQCPDSMPSVPPLVYNAVQTRTESAMVIDKLSPKPSRPFYRRLIMLQRLVIICFYTIAKKLTEWSRVCHNHKSQPTLDTKRKRKMTKTYTRKTTSTKKKKKSTRSTKTSSLFPKRGDQYAKTNGETRTKSTRRL